MTVAKPDKSVVTIYSCGGAATNIVKDIPQVIDDHTANLCPYYIDTSASNLRRAKVPAENVYLFEGVDGSGKIRSENYELISKNILKILQQFKPSKFSVVVHSASGGSGSVIASSLVAELRSRGEQVVVITIGSTDSQIEIENTIKTLKSYESIAAKLDKPIIMHYLENSQETKRSDVDQMVSQTIAALLLLFSGMNEEMDTADLRSWMNHPKLPAELMSLHLCESKEAYQRAGTVYTVATLSRYGADTSVTPVPAYQTTGYVSEDKNHSFLTEEPLHFAVSSDYVSTVSKALTAKLKEVDAHLSSSVRRSSLLDRNDNPTANGIVL